MDVISIMLWMTVDARKLKIEFTSSKLQVTASGTSGSKDSRVSSTTLWWMGKSPHDPLAFEDLEEKKTRKVNVP